MSGRYIVSTRALAALLICWDGRQAMARPKPQEEQPASTSSTASVSVVPVTSETTQDGSVIGATFTPTSLAISGLEPPITAATTVTTTDSAGETVAIAIAAGAGVVAGGALAAWLFKPAPGAPAPPTSPPSYPTSTQDADSPETTTDESLTTSTSISSTTSAATSSSAAPACHLPTGSPEFALAPEQPQWTAEIPSQTVSFTAPECTSSNENGDVTHLLHGLPPDFIEELADLFCASDLSQDVEKTIGKNDLPNGSSWKRDDAPEDVVTFTFDLNLLSDGCAENCKSAYGRIITRCQYDHNNLYGAGSIQQGCGTYSLKIEGDPFTKLTCTGDGDNPLRDYLDRDAALEAINNFCSAQDGKTIQQGDESSFLQETTFTVRYADECAGSGTYTVKKDLCVDFLTQTLDGCDTATSLFKHGGVLQDVDNCGLFEFHPTGYDLVECYPGNKEKGYIQGGTNVPVTQYMAMDAINAFCDRSGDGQTYTLDPDVQPSVGFTQDTCTSEGMAACGYFYKNDGTRVTDEGEVGDLLIRMEASHFNPNNALECNPAQAYEIHGDRCKQMLGIFTGTGLVDQCTANGPDKLDLGTIIEAGDKGCVTWNMWAVSTHG